jgi:hypothetical protein
MPQQSQAPAVIASGLAGRSQSLHFHFFLKYSFITI